MLSNTSPAVSFLYIVAHQVIISKGISAPLGQVANKSITEHYSVRALLNQELNALTIPRRLLLEPHTDKKLAS